MRRVGSILMLAVIVSAPAAAIAVWSISRTVLDVFDPSVRWEPSTSADGSFSGSVYVGRNQTRRVNGESKLRAITVCALVPGVVLLCTLLATIGVALGRPWMIFIAAVLMLVETPVTYSIAPLTAATGLLYLFLANRVVRTVQAVSSSRAERL